MPHEPARPAEPAAQEEEKNPTPPGSEPVGREECEVCGARMLGLHCKLVCPRCGFRRDCSDP
ncbi:hypothetical protein [Rubrobacter xylanophilus]|uniref:hypothetical protein n=1 Tax=Rubrobacter xylanophilus TaxID=49319 RepID=UPI00003A284C|nr:hypothetical protein [Rubrobacter xylanophilus]